MKNEHPTCYIAGKMRGLPEFGFPLFDQARDWLIKAGWRVISPADMDRMIGFDEKAPGGYDFDLEDAMRRDFLVILTQVTDIVLLPNWRSSTGARSELLLAHNIGVTPWEIDMQTGELHLLTVESAIVVFSTTPERGLEHAGS